MTGSQGFVFETERLLLRHLIFQDLNDLWALYRNPEIIKYIPDAPRSREEAQEELEWHMNGHPKYPEFGLWATIYKENKKFIGRCGLLPWMIDGQHEVEIAYTIVREYWGQGLATEAAQGILNYGFGKLNLSRLICLIDPENIASQKVAEKIGMTFEKESLDDMGLFWVYSINK